MADSHSATEPCGDPCLLDENGTVDCSECGDYCVCDIPVEPPGHPVQLPCVPLESAVASLAEDAGQENPGVRALVRVPVVSQPERIRTVRMPISDKGTSVHLHGWHIVFIRNGTGPSTPVVTPATVPNKKLAMKDKVLSASVILPENDGPRQYWVPVGNQSRWARLETSGWTVMFSRDPSP